MTEPALIVDDTVFIKLQNKFPLVFDGSSEKSTHYMVVFAIYYSFHSCGYEKVLLAFSPLNDEEPLNLENHVDCISLN